MKAQIKEQKEYLKLRDLGMGIPDEELRFGVPGLYIR